MRQIKFRYRLQSYVIKEDNKPFFVYINLDDLEMYSQGLIVLEEFIENRWGDDINNYKILSRDEWIGLKDKNSKEIYEGDIVIFKNYKYIIYYCELNSWWYGRQPRKTDGNTLDGAYTGGINGQDLRKVEVIGNICENPELLEIKGINNEDK